MASDSVCVGFTFPGIMEEPGSLEGNSNSPNPALGPLANRRISLVILYNETASVRNVPESCTKASCDPCTANLLGAEKNGISVIFEISKAAVLENSIEALMPVPTAVPPNAIGYNALKAFSKRIILSDNIPAYPDHSCSREIGVASCKCVRPTLTIDFQEIALVRMPSCNTFRAGINLFFKATAEAICMAVGNVSLDDCDLFAWSLG